MTVKHIKMISSQIPVMNECREKMRREGWKTRKGGVRYIFIYEAL